ncbi:hypothetical protein NM688_g5853 [Phlebia brevispora]|uniref:Uncharacterized protein n=1 Tax=Phlebia brevispora TaxID=194682 RepID=A0ACC1SNR6_9APHY|nr:hypothetical protein NM688_g5853 [Phlebia brevispora]
MSGVADASRAANHKRALCNHEWQFPKRALTPAAYRESMIVIALSVAIPLKQEDAQSVFANSTAESPIETLGQTSPHRSQGIFSHLSMSSTIEEEPPQAHKDSSKLQGSPQHPSPPDTSSDQYDDDFQTKDFGFLPIPRRLQYDPDSAPHFGWAMNILFAIASTFVVANLYYCQPLLLKLSESFNVSYSEVSRIPTLVQSGYAAGLLLVTPLGDLVRRRPLILGLTFCGAALTIGLPITKSVAAFEAISFLVGLASVVPQIMLPLAADLAPPERRASALAIVLSGLLLGILIARVLSGVVAQFVTWHVVYWIALGVQSGLFVLLYWTIPDFPAKNKHLTYFRILFTLGKFAVTEPVLAQACLVVICSSACFTNFWVTLTFLLGEDPYSYSTLVIGLFGLEGMFGVCVAPFLGRLIDNLIPWFATFIAIIAFTCFQAVQTGAGGVSIAAVIIACLGIDIFGDMIQISLTHAVFGLDPNARARLNAVLIISIFLGQIMGTSVGTHVFVNYGWRPAAALSLGFSGFMLLAMLARGPHCERYTWFGWQGGYEMRKARQDEADALREEPVTDSVPLEKVDHLDKEVA